MRNKLNLNRTPLKNTNKHCLKRTNLKSFRLSPQNLQNIPPGCITSEFINHAIASYYMLLKNPEKIMIELKQRHQSLWKYVNRKKFM